jgi:starvation-inducible outer membrane lipoprotein
MFIRNSNLNFLVHMLMNIYELWTLHFFYFYAPNVFAGFMFSKYFFTYVNEHLWKYHQICINLQQYSDCTEIISKKIAKL